jgi:hypothetical protein
VLADVGAQRERARADQVDPAAGKADGPGERIGLSGGVHAEQLGRQRLLDVDLVWMTDVVVMS